jgi:hypothetical protein
VLLSLRSACQAGYPVEARVFSKAIDFLHGATAGKGARAEDPTVSDHARVMVAAWICWERLSLLDPKNLQVGRARQLAERTPLLDPLFRDPEKPPDIECLWIIEQLGSLTGQAELGGRIWYREGTNRILAAPWLSKKPETSEEAFSLCYALLFLKRSTAPLVAGR